MKDRIPGAPGQYKAVVTEEELLKMQAGEAFAITMTRDDQPIEEGTPYNKAAVLPDKLAQQLCPDIEDPTPADAFDALANRMKAKAGFIYPLATEVVPDGFLLCDGAEYDREEYPELFAAIGTMYGEGDGETTFNVPNLATRVPVGAGEEYELGQTGGEAEHTLTVDEMPSHRHTETALVQGYSGWSDFTTDQYSVIHDYTGNYVAPNQTLKTASVYSGDTTPKGGDQPHNNMQPYTVVNYIIATGKETAVSVSDIIIGAQAIPLEVQYGGTGATNGQDACKNINALHAIESTEHPGCYYRMVDGEQEWINPPFVFHEEYKTTERVNGKAVYAKCFGVHLTSSDVLAFDLDAHIIKLHAWSTYAKIIPSNNPNTDWDMGLSARSDGIHVLSGDSIVAQEDASAWFQVWYVKW